MKTLTADDVLSAPAEYDHIFEVRAIGPAVVLVLEREAPLRMETLATTGTEFDALREWVGSNPYASHILGAYFEAKEAEEGTEHTGLWLREDEHASRLQAGNRLSTLRVTDLSGRAP